MQPSDKTSPETQLSLSFYSFALPSEKMWPHHAQSSLWRRSSVTAAAKKLIYIYIFWNSLFFPTMPSPNWCMQNNKKHKLTKPCDYVIPLTHITVLNKWHCFPIKKIAQELKPIYELSVTTGLPFIKVILCSNMIIKTAICITLHLSSWHSGEVAAHLPTE